MKFCLIHHIHLTSCQPTSTSLSSFTTFCRENASTTNLKQKILAKSSLNTKAQIFMLQEQSNLFLIGKNTLIVMVLILMANDVFELSYDLKFTVRNYKYFCTNLNVKHAIKHFTHFSLHVGNQCFTLVFSCVPQQLLKPEIRWILLSTF